MWEYVWDTVLISFFVRFIFNADERMSVSGEWSRTWALMRYRVDLEYILRICSKYTNVYRFCYHENICSECLRLFITFTLLIIFCYICFKKVIRCFVYYWSNFSTVCRKIWWTRKLLQILKPRGRHKGTWSTQCVKPIHQVERSLMRCPQLSSVSQAESYLMCNWVCPGCH